VAESRWRARVTRLALTTFLATSLLSAARATHTPFGWVAALLCVPALLLQRRVLPARWPRLYERLVVLTLALLVVVGFAHTAYPIFPEPATRSVVAALALALGLLTLPATFAQRALSAARVHLPAGAGLLLASALSVSGETQRFVMPELLSLPLLALVLYLLAERAPLTSRQAEGLALRRGLRLTLSLGVAVLIAFGTTRLLPWAQPFVERAFTRFFGERATQASSGFGKESRLGDVESLALDHTLALRVWTDAPRLLRLRVGARFDGHAWKSDPALTRRDPLPAAAALPSGLALGRLAEVPGAVFVVAEAGRGEPAAWGRVLPAIVLETEALAAPLGTRVVRAPDARLERDGFGIIFAASTAELGLFGYLATPQPPRATQTEGQLAAFLELPPVVDARLRALASELAGKATGSSARVAVTLERLQRECHYALEVGRFDSDDPVAEFVFVKRRGYCEYFATAAALLLRLEGVPTRYVTGFSGRAASRVGDHYLVRLSDAHAWIEYFDGQGWREADPTPPAEYDLLHARDEGWWVATWESLRSTFDLLATTLRQALSTGSWLAPVRLTGALLYGLLVRHATWLAVILCVALAWWRLPWARWWGRLAGGRDPVPTETNALLAWRAQWLDVERQLARRGLLRAASCPPLEFARSLPDTRVPPELRQLAEEVALALYAGLFAGRPPGDEAHSRLRERVDIARRRHDNRSHWEVT
jgi:transglutaminase-like putative cysteine protease